MFATLTRSQFCLKGLPAVFRLSFRRQTVQPASAFLLHCGLSSDADAGPGLDPRMEEGNAKRMSRAQLCRRDIHSVKALR
jgi:hypothetical protein